MVGLNLEKKGHSVEIRENLWQKFTYRCSRDGIVFCCCQIMIVKDHVSMRSKFDAIRCHLPRKIGQSKKDNLKKFPFPTHSNRGLKSSLSAWSNTYRYTRCRHCSDRSETRPANRGAAGIGRGRTTWSQRKACGRGPARRASGRARARAGAASVGCLSGTRCSLASAWWTWGRSRTGSCSLSGRLSGRWRSFSGRYSACCHCLLAPGLLLLFPTS